MPHMVRGEGAGGREFGEAVRRYTCTATRAPPDLRGDPAMFREFG